MKATRPILLRRVSFRILQSHAARRRNQPNRMFESAEEISESVSEQFVGFTHQPRLLFSAADLALPIPCRGRSRRAAAELFVSCGSDFTGNWRLRSSLFLGLGFHFASLSLQNEAVFTMTVYVQVSIQFHLFNPRRRARCIHPPWNPQPVMSAAGVPAHLADCLVNHARATRRSLPSPSKSAFGYRIGFDVQESAVISAPVPGVQRFSVRPLGHSGQQRGAPASQQNPPGSNLIAQSPTSLGI